jgi:ATP-dependent Clp protease ATP-binding subunit ClpA
MELQTQLDDKHVTLEISEDAREWLAIHGYDVQMGARPMARLIQDKLKKPLAEAILFGDLSHGGGTVEVDLDPINDQLEIEITAKQQPAVQTAKV